MKRAHAIEDAGDRAQKHRKTGLVRIPLDKIGFWQHNRGGIGINSHHVHEVAWDCKANKTKLQRYQHVDIIEIPQDCSKQFLDANRERCTADNLMPRFSPDITYVCASKTHFVHAQKLAKEGCRSIFNNGNVPIRWQEADTEGALILEQGPLCALYTSDLLHDLDATHALAADDNLNAGVQAFGRVHEMMERLGLEGMAAPSQVNGATVDVLIASLQVAGLGKFSCDEWKHLIALRVSLPGSVAKVLQACQFGVCAGRVRVRPSDFGLSAKLDPRAPWAKVSLMLWQYIGSIDGRCVDANATTFVGRTEVTAKKMNGDCINELVGEPSLVCSVDSFIKQMMSKYAQPQSCESMVCIQKELLIARGELMANCGRYLLKVGHALETAAKREISKQGVLAPRERIGIVERESKGRLSRLEDFFRRELLKRKLYAEDALPQAAFPMEVVTAPSQAEGANHPCKMEHNPSKMEEDAPTVAHVAPDELTVAHVYERLRVTGCGEDVMACVNGVMTVVKSEKTDEASAVAEAGLIDAVEGSQPSANSSAWRIVKLVSISLPDAVVELNDGGNIDRFTKPVDDLRAVCKAEVKKVILHPCLQEIGKPQDPYDYDLCQTSFMKAVSDHMLLWAHAAVPASVARVGFSRLSDDDKLPFVLQLRALEPLKKGSLVLAPAYGRLLPQGADASRDLARSQGVLHAAMLSHVDVKVVAASNDRRFKKEGLTRESAFLIFSPLLAGKPATHRADCMKNLAPFWALLRCPGFRSPHNMELDTMVFRDAGFDAKGYPQVPKGVSFTAQIPIARNVCHIAAGDVLTLPFDDE